VIAHLLRNDLQSQRASNYIGERLFDHHDHFDAEELYQRLKERQAGVSRATVYRTLILLDQSGLVRKMEIGENRSLYEHILGHPHHDHLICLSCGRLQEFSHPLIEEMQSQVCAQHSFGMLSHALQIYGFCRECQAKETTAQ
jgi:Fur family ferric uptake transcriptional regulator